MSTMFDQNLLPEFESIKDDDEEIIWTGKPVFIPYLFGRMGATLLIFIFGLIWLLVNMNFDPESDKGSSDFFWLFGLIPIIQGVYFFLHKLFSYSNTAYAYSNKRVMMRTGFIGTDFKTIDYDKISDTEVNVNILERIYNVGTIRFFSGRTETHKNNTTKLYDEWLAIENPYEIFKLVKQTSVDIKTDFNYPNALRPETNPGYKTKYEKES